MPTRLPASSLVPPPGRLRPVTHSLAGTLWPGNNIFTSSPITCVFLFFPGYAFPIWQATFLDSLLAASGTIGYTNTDIPFICSKPLSSGNAFKSPLTRLPIGYLSVKQKDGLETTDTIPFAYPIKDIYLYPLIPNFREALHGIS